MPLKEGYAVLKGNVVAGVRAKPGADHSERHQRDGRQPTKAPMLQYIWLGSWWQVRGNLGRRHEPVQEREVGPGLAHHRPRAQRWGLHADARHAAIPVISRSPVISR